MVTEYDGHLNSIRPYMSIKFTLPARKTIPMKTGNGGLSLKGSNGATLILIHGLTGTPNEMKSLATHFHKRGYSILCPWLANHGEPIQVLSKTKWQDCYGSVRDVFLKADNALGKGPIFASGISMGALLALLLAYEFPERIAGVNCLSPTLFYDGWNTPWQRHLLPLAYLTPLKHFVYYKEEPPYGIKNEALRNQIHRYYSQATLATDEGVLQYGYPYFPVSLLHQLNLLVQASEHKAPFDTHAPADHTGQRRRYDECKKFSVHLRQSRFEDERTGSSL